MSRDPLLDVDLCLVFLFLEERIYNVEPVVHYQVQVVRRCVAFSLCTNVSFADAVAITEHLATQSYCNSRIHKRFDLD